MTKSLLMTLIVSGFAFATFAAEVPEGPARLPTGITLHKAVVYSRVDRSLKMDLYLPRASEKAVPCVIVIQGGGFRPQDGQRFRPFAEYLADNGFAAALIAYRGRPDHTYRDTIADVKAAVRFVRKVGGNYGIDTGRIGAMGRSAGGTLAALLAVTGGMKEFDEDRAPSEPSCRIQAAVAIAGVYDFVARFSDPQQIAMQPALRTKLESNGEWIGSPFSPRNEDWLDASPINHVDSTDPPMLLMHSKNDPVVPWLQSRAMNARLRAAGVPSEIEIYDTGGHGVQPKGPEDPKARMIAFFRKVLVEQPAASESANRRSCLQRTKMNHHEGHEEHEAKTDCLLGRRHPLPFRHLRGLRDLRGARPSCVLLGSRSSVMLHDSS